MKQCGTQLLISPYPTAECVRVRTCVRESVCTRAYYKTTCLPDKVALVAADNIVTRSLMSSTVIQLATWCHSIGTYHPIDQVIVLMC